MSDRSKRILLGVFLVVAGTVFLLQQLLGIPIGGLFIALVFIAGGAVFLYFLARDREKWWLVIPGFTLAAIGLLIAINELLPKAANNYGGSIFLASLALSFLVIYFLKRTQWWAIIPAGALLTLALIAGLRFNGVANGGLLFLGIGATFAVLGLMPVGREEKWPWIPAGICLLLGMVLLVTSGALVDSILGWIWALGLILVGGYFIIRAFVKK